MFLNLHLQKDGDSSKYFLSHYFSVIKQKLLWLLYDRGDLDRWEIPQFVKSIYIAHQAIVVFIFL